MKAQQYIFPKIGVTTNGMQLKLNSQKILKQHYEQQMLPKLQKQQYSSSSLSSLTHQKNQIRSNNLGSTQQKMMIEGSPTNKGSRNVEQEMIKNSWSQELDHQIALKQHLTRSEKDHNLFKQSILVRSNKHLQNIQTLKQKQFLQSFKQQAIYNLKMKELRKKQEKQKQKLQKEYYHQQYIKSHQAIENILQGKLTEGYKNVNQSSEKEMSIRKSRYLNPQGASDMYMNIQSSRQQHKQFLRETLLQQIKHTQQKRIHQKRLQSESPYLNPQQQIIDNPIINPIDIKIAKDNPYIMKELLRNKNTKDQVPRDTLGKRSLSKMHNHDDKHANLDQSKQSYLSKRGSTSLLTKYY